MSAITDWVKKNTKGVGVADLGFGALSAVQIATAQSKFGELFRQVREFAVFKITWPFMITTAFVGMVSAIRSVVRESGSLEAALRRVASVQGLSNQFAGLLQSVSLARARVAELVGFTRSNPLFDFEQVGRGGRALEVLTRGLFSNGKALNSVGDAAAANGLQFDAVAEAAGGFFDTLRRGESIDSASEQLRQMGLVTEQGARRMVELQRAGAPTGDVFRVLTSEMERFNGAMERQKKTIPGKLAAHEAAGKNLKEQFGAPFVDAQMKGTEAGTAVMEKLAPVANGVASALAGVANPFSDLGTRAAAFVLNMRGVPTILESIGRGATAAFTGITILATAKGLLNIGSLLNGATQKNLAAKAAGFGEKAVHAGANADWMEAEGLNGVAKLRAMEAGYKGAEIGFKGASLAAKGFAGALGMVARAFGPMLVITGIITLLGYLWKKYDEHNRAIEAMAALMQSHAAAEKSIERQIAAMRTLDDQLSVVAETAGEYAEAMKKAREARAAGNDREAAEYELHARKIQKRQKEAEATTGLAPGAKEQARIDDDARMGIQVREAQFQAKLSTANPQQQLAMRAAKIEEEKGKLEEGKNLRADRIEVETKTQSIDARISAGEKGLEGATDEKEADSRITTLRMQEAIGPEANVVTNTGLMLSGAGGSMVSPVQTIGNGGISEKGQEELKRLLGEKAQRDEIQALKAEREKTQLEGRGLIGESARTDKEEREGGITHAEAQSRRSTIAARQYDLESRYEQRGSEVPQMQAAQEMQQREFALAQMRVGTEKEIADLKSRGFDRAEAEYQLRKQLLDKEIAIEQAKAQPDNEKIAGLQAQESDLARQRAASKREEAVYDTDTQRGLDINRARREGRGDDVVKLGDLDSFAKHYEAARGAGKNEDDAKRIATEQSKDDILQSAADLQRNGVVDSLTRIGGGGGVSADPALSAAERTASLMDKAVSYLAAIAAKEPEDDRRPWEIDITP